MINKRYNLAFIDGQNLYMGTTKCHICAKNKNIDFKNIKLSDCECGNAWQVDLKKFRTYLRDTYQVEKAYYYLGFIVNVNKTLYDTIQEAGFILRFRKHTNDALSKKKGNVDTEIIFDIMKDLYKQVAFDKIVLVSSDGDYEPVVTFLVEENKFEKILFPNGKYASSLYNKLDNRYKLALNRIRPKIELHE